MKGKTGKSAMRGGGMARKGVGAALKGGGMARRGIGQALADGGPPAPTTAAVNPAGRTLPAQARAYGLRDRTDGPGKGMMRRPGFPSSPPIGSAMGAIGQVPWTPGTGTQITLGGLTPSTAPKMKRGGKVAKYAKGGAVKMTAGAGSGSGRLEKVAAHKSAKRVPAQNLKHGGKAKGK